MITVFVSRLHGTIEKLSGHVEADETFIGGKARNMHVAKRPRRSLERAARTRRLSSEFLSAVAKVRTAVIPNRKKKALQSEVRKHVEAGPHSTRISFCHTKDWRETTRIRWWIMPLNTLTVQVHTNGLENYWSLLKRSISGTYVSVEPYPSVPLPG